MLMLDSKHYVAGADWELRAAVANLTKSALFVFAFPMQFWKQAALEWPAPALY